MPTNIVLIGAGSAAFAMTLLRDAILTEGLRGAHMTLMDIDEAKLKTSHTLSERYAREAGAEITFSSTTSRKEALEGADFVICAVKVGGYEPLEEERRISTEKGYYRGIGDRVSCYYGGVGAYHQFRFLLDLARDMEEICPQAWLINTANPVFDGTNLVTRTTRVKAVGICHGQFAVDHLTRALELDTDKVVAQAVGFNHFIYLTEYRYNGEDAYPLIDKWIDEKVEDFWKSEAYLNPDRAWTHEQVSPGAVDAYKLYGLFPIGDAVRAASPWWHHTDLETKKKWYGPMGGFDSEIGWASYLKGLSERSGKQAELAEKPVAELLEAYPLRKSREQHIPFIDAVANDRDAILQLNIPNKGCLDGFPDDVLVEVPVLVNAGGVQGVKVKPISETVMRHILIPRWLRLESMHAAFINHDRQELVRNLMDDPRTRSYEQAKDLIDTLLALPWNKEAAEHYR